MVIGYKKTFCEKQVRGIMQATSSSYVLWSLNRHSVSNGGFFVRADPGL
jgi:hypothetical protein